VAFFFEVLRLPAGARTPAVNGEPAGRLVVLSRGFTALTRDLAIAHAPWQKGNQRAEYGYGNAMMIISW
jgi:hypothetical protein